VLFNEPEEFAKNYTGGAAYNDPTEPVTGQFVVLRTPQDFTSRYFDLDEEALPFVEGYNTIVMRRSPDASRPPANYRLTYVNEWYEVWRKQPGEQVVDHLPLQKPHVAALRPDCAAVTALARKARPGDELVAARRPATLVLDTARAKRSAGWVDHPYMPDMVITVTPGKAAETVRAAEGGRYRAWLAGSFSRPIESRIDGRDIGAVAQVNNLGQWLPVRTVTVSPGRHRLEIERGGGGLGPGDGYSGELGPLVLEAAKPIELRRFPPDRARSLCSSPWDWVEVVRPR
jgi:hypothetical protein